MTIRDYLKRRFRFEMLFVLAIIVAAILAHQFARDEGILNTVLGIAAVISIPAAFVAVNRTPCPRCARAMGIVAWTAGDPYGFGTDIRCPHCQTHVDDLILKGGGE